MPDGVAALRGIGVELGPEHGAPFRGIRFLENELEAEASFPKNRTFGLGVRRTLLHRILTERAEDAGVVMRWQSRVEALDPSGVKVDGRIVRCRWIIGADGFHSRVRRWTGLLPVRNSARRIGFRQHFCVRPWTDFVEVYWHNHCQAYVTPVGENEVCVAMIASAREVRLSDLSTLFPALAKRLRGAEPTDSPRGAMTMSVKLSGRDPRPGRIGGRCIRVSRCRYRGRARLGVSPGKGSSQRVSLPEILGRMTPSIAGSVGGRGSWRVCCFSWTATTACGGAHYVHWRRVLASSAACWPSTWARYGRTDLRRRHATRLNLDHRQSCGIFPRRRREKRNHGGPGSVPRHSDFNNLDCQTVLSAIMGVKGFLLRCKIRIVATPTKDRELPNAALSSEASSLSYFCCVPCPVPGR